MAQQDLVAVPQQPLAAGLQRRNAAGRLVMQHPQQLRAAQLVSVRLVHHAVQCWQQYLCTAQCISALQVRMVRPPVQKPQ